MADFTKAYAYEGKEITFTFIRNNEDKDKKPIEYMVDGGAFNGSFTRTKDGWVYNINNEQATNFRQIPDEIQQKIIQMLNAISNAPS